jgi:hypothetical protein
MLRLFTLFFALSAAGTVTATPARFSKRIAQVIADSTRQWEAACVSLAHSLATESFTNALCLWSGQGGR